MIKLEKQCKDMSDVCELAHKRTVKDIAKLNKKLPRRNWYYVNCLGIMDCTDGGQDHSPKADGTHYGAKAQEIFNDHYDHIIGVTGL